jgi:hypothetical protein
VTKIEEIIERGAERERQTEVEIEEIEITLEIVKGHRNGGTEVMKDAEVEIEVEIGEGEGVAMMTGDGIAVVTGKEGGIGVAAMIEDEEEVVIVTEVETDILDEVHRHQVALPPPEDQDHGTIENTTLPITVQILPRNISPLFLLALLSPPLLHHPSHCMKPKKMMTLTRSLIRTARPPQPSILTSSSTPPRNLIKCLERKRKLLPLLLLLLEPSHHLHLRAAVMGLRRGRWSIGIS